MKYFITDTSNDGVIWVGKSLPVANAIRRGLLDCDLYFLGEHSDQYMQLIPKLVQEQYLKYDNKDFRVINMTVNAVNDLYLEKRRLANLRSLPMLGLFNWSYGSTRKTSISHIPSIDNDITFSLLESDPENGKYEQSIQEYSDILGISVEEGYKELKLLSENFRTRKIRTFAYTEYFVNKINNAYNEDQIKEINEEINRKFNLDVRI